MSARWACSAYGLSFGFSMGMLATLPALLRMHKHEYFMKERLRMLRPGGAQGCAQHIGEAQARRVCGAAAAHG